MSDLNANESKPADVKPGAPPAAPPAAAGPAVPTITYAEFKRMQLVVGQVVSVEPHPNADKLLVLKVNLGGEERQLVAGLRGYYTPEQLVGKQVVVLANLEPKALRGMTSHGMLLAAESDGQVVVISPERPLPPGAKVL